MRGKTVSSPRLARLAVGITLQELSDATAIPTCRICEAERGRVELRADEVARIDRVIELAVRTKRRRV
jgi:hypothetical protein